MDLSECYRTLGLEPGATPDQIHSAYRELAQVWHPDRFVGKPGLQTRGTEQLARINEAYERLRSAPRERPTVAPPPPRPPATTTPTAPPPRPAPATPAATLPRWVSLAGIAVPVAAAAVVLGVLVARAMAGGAGGVVGGRSDPAAPATADSAAATPAPPPASGPDSRPRAAGAAVGEDRLVARLNAVRTGIDRDLRSVTGETVEAVEGYDSLRLFRLGAAPVKIVGWIAGPAGTLVRDFYYRGGRAFFSSERFAAEPLAGRPMRPGPRYYLEDDRLIRWIDAGGHELRPATVRERDLYSALIAREAERVFRAATVQSAP